MSLSWLIVLMLPMAAVSSGCGEQISTSANDNQSSQLVDDQQAPDPGDLELTPEEDASIPPIYPAGFTASVEDSGRVLLNWIGTEAEDVIGYALYRSDGGESPSEIAQVDSRPKNRGPHAYRDMLPERGTYRYQICATRQDGIKGNRSPEVTIEWQ